MSRVVVVGAGVGGLAAAIRLAATGHSVTVCEQAAEVGGKLGYYERDGFQFDTGPSLLTMPLVFADLFAETGAPIDAALDLTPVEPIAHYRFADGTELDASADLDVFCAELDGALGAGSGADWRAFMTRAGHIWDATRGPFLDSALTGPLGLARQAVRLADLRAIAPGRTLRSLGQQYLGDPRLRMFLDRYATYTGSDPRRAPAALAVVPYVEQTFGAWYVAGGLRRIADALAERAVRLGATLRLGTDVSEVSTGPRGVTGVRLASGEVLAADVVVANADARHLYEDLVPDRRADRARRRLARSTPSLSGFVLLLGVRGTTPGLAHHTVLFPAAYDDEFDAVFTLPQPVPDPTIYLSVPKDAAIAPAGCEAWFVLVNAPRQGPVDWDSPGLADRYADSLLALMAARGVDVRDRVVFREIRTPADLERRTRAVGGAIYGTSSNGARAAFLRPANASPVPGLYLVGGSSHPGGGLPLVVLSAKIVAGLVGPAAASRPGRPVRRAPGVQRGRADRS
ncbi:MAG: phytoene desaturase family protein [Actinomycetota bacterium]|nr:phytoene desaturase family protein [Actinomycetota bacterium]